MATSGESSTADVLDHYASYDSSSSNRPDRMPRLRNDSNQSARNGMMNQQLAMNNLTLRSPAGDSLSEEDQTKPYSPLNTPSQKSSSSSLRHSVAMLKGGVFPPGLSMRRRRDSTDSDGSHYDDEDDHGYDMEKGGPFESRPASASASYDQHPDSRSDTNHAESSLAGDNSGSKRQSQHQTPMQGSFAPLPPDSSGWERTPLQHVIGLGVDDTGVVKTPKMNDQRSISPNRKHPHENKTAKEAAQSRAGTHPKTRDDDDDDEEAMHRQQSVSSDNDDPNRPRTLKEARALAKERAKMRAQAKGGSEAIVQGGSTVADGVPGSAERPLRGERRPSLASLTSASSNLSLGSDGKKTALAKGDLEQPQRHSRQLASPRAANLDLLALRRHSDSPYNIPSPTSANAMEALQNAIGDAIEDVSFASTGTSATTAAVLDAIPPSNRPRTNTSINAIQEGRLELPSTRAVDLDNESSAPSVASFDSAKESQTVSRPHSTVVHSRGEPTWTKENEKEEGDSLPSRNVLPHSEDHTASPATIPLIASVSSPFALATATDQRSATEQQFRPHSMKPQQRSTAPNKIARLDVYGRTVPWPAAFNPDAIIEQKRLAPWERARSYAHYCNDLAKIPTGLEIWIDMVQRPAQRVSTEPITPLKQHKRGEGTDHSGYAMSVRSDATFPVRGDGGRAKELQLNMPSTIEESPPGNLPSNLPYPSLAQQSIASTSLSSVSEMSTSQSSDRDRSGRPSNFFSNLGRAKSTRRTPGSGSFTSLGPLISGVTSSTGAPPTRGPTRAKGKSISSPMNMSSSPSVTLGSRSVGMDSNTAQDGQSSPSLQGSQSRSHLPPSASVTSQGGIRTPMGPRAQSSGMLPSINQPESRRESISNLAVQEKSSTPSLKDNLSAVSAADYSSPSPLMSAVKSSLNYGSVRSNRSPNMPGAALQPPPSSTSHRTSGDYTGKRSSSNNSRRGSQVSGKPASAAENEALDKLADVLPDAERSTLLEYLRKAGGNDLIAIGDYLQAQSKSEGRHLLR